MKGLVNAVIVKATTQHETETATPVAEADITFRRPRRRDRSDIESLIGDDLLIENDQPMLDGHDQPALVAEHDDTIVGYVSAHEPQGATKLCKTLAIRHFALRDALHETNIASRMIKALLDRHTEDQSMRYVETDIASFGDAPQSMLYTLVKQLKTKFRYVFPNHEPSEGDHPVVCRIGPVQD